MTESQQYQTAVIEKSIWTPSIEELLTLRLERGVSSNALDAQRFTCRFLRAVLYA